MHFIYFFSSLMMTLLLMPTLINTWLALAKSKREVDLYSRTLRWHKNPRLPLLHGLFPKTAINQSGLDDRRLKKEKIIKSDF